MENDKNKIENDKNLSQLYFNCLEYKQNQPPTKSNRINCEELIHTWKGITFEDILNKNKKNTFSDKDFIDS
jgi:hypothetical protein